jgi:hypothetical protein
MYQLVENKPVRPGFAGISGNLPICGPVADRTQKKPRRGSALALPSRQCDRADRVPQNAVLAAARCPCYLLTASAIKNIERGVPQ